MCVQYSTIAAGCMSVSTVVYFLQTEEAMIRPLEGQGIKRLYPNPDYGKRLYITCLLKSSLPSTV